MKNVLSRLARGTVRNLISLVAITLVFGALLGGFYAAAVTELTSAKSDTTLIHIYALDSAGYSVQDVRIESFQKNSRFGGGQWLIRETDARGFVEFEIEKGYPAFISVKRDEQLICSDEPYGIGRSIKKHALDGVEYIFNPETCTFRQNSSLGTIG